MPILYHNGDFASVVDLARRLRQCLPSRTVRDDGEGQGSASLVNGVHMAVVGLSFWPAALACQRAPREASEAALAEVLAAAEACRHPPTRAYVLAHLSSDYFRIICDPVRGANAAALAEELATNHGLLHCNRFEQCC